jgi:hypothetical protein
VRLADEEVERILAEYLRDHPADVVDDAAYRKRLALCGECGDLQYGTTCSHCGCLAPVMAKLADRRLLIAGGRGLSLDRRIRWEGLVDNARKRELLARACVLLNPIRWPEPW